jgi:hypothetical protein
MMVVSTRLNSPCAHPALWRGDSARGGVLEQPLVGCAGRSLSLVTFVVVVFVGAQFNPNFGWALVVIGGVPFVGAGVGAIFGAAFLAAKPSFELAAVGGCLGGILTGAFPLVDLFR